MHEYLSDPPVCFPPQLHNAANANQKEKYEADLKKEIKKLQVKAERKTRLLPQNDPFRFRFFCMAPRWMENEKKRKVFMDLSKLS